MNLKFRILLDNSFISGETATGQIDTKFAWRMIEALNETNNDIRVFLSREVFHGSYKLFCNGGSDLGDVYFNNDNSCICRITLNRSQEAELYKQRYIRQSIDLLIDFTNCKVEPTKDGPVLTKGEISKVSINQDLKALKELIEARRKERQSIEERSNDYFKTFSGS